MEQEAAPISGEVEADETFMAGKLRASERKQLLERRGLPERARGPWLKKSPIVFAAVQRGGRVRAQVIPSSHHLFLGQALRELVLPESMLFTDDWHGYHKAGKTYYRHRRINHSAKVVVAADGSRAHTRSKASSACSRPASAEPTTQSRDGGYRASSTSGYGGTTAGTTTKRCFGSCSPAPRSAEHARKARRPHEDQPQYQRPRGRDEHGSGRAEADA
ncbi:MAG TPA: transposase [Gaiellaceae bacterium]